MDRAEAEERARNGVVVGMKALTGKVVPRYDIDVFLCRYPDAFNLMLLAIAEMQQDKGLLGYFQLAGIHGLPTGKWDNVGKQYVDSYKGYCAHGVLIFPTWHRPYLALFEQTIYLKMVDIAKRYNGRHQDRYLEATGAFRLPYFDYYRPRGGKVDFPGQGDGGMTSFDYNFCLPDVFNEERIRVRQAPDDKSTEIDNPLCHYKFTEKSGCFSTQDFDNDVKGLFPSKQTVRHPNTVESEEHDLELLSSKLNMGREGGTAMFLDIINSSAYTRLETVATDKPENSLLGKEPSTNGHEKRDEADEADEEKEVEKNGDGGEEGNKQEQNGAKKDDWTGLTQGDITRTYGVVRGRDAEDAQGVGSLEGTIHGNMHQNIGGQIGKDTATTKAPSGHMTDPLVASFDPVFWFHHCNIDRAWALWQAIHPNSWFPETRDRDNNLERKKPLLPFYKTKTASGEGTFWNSDDTRETETFGYYYDDFEFSKTNEDDKIWIGLLNKYRWAIRTPVDRDFRNPPRYMMPLDIKSTQFFGGNSRNGGLVEITQADAEKAPYSDKEIDPKFNREWFVDSQVKRAAANGPFTIYFFLGPSTTITHTPTTYADSPCLAGINHIFTAPRETCSNCFNLEQAGQLSSDTTPLTGLLLDYVKRRDEPRLEDLRPENVVPFLVRFLRWRVVYANGGEQDPKDVPGFAIRVSAKRIEEDGHYQPESYPEVYDAIMRSAD